MYYRYNPLHEKRKQALFERLRKHMMISDDHLWEILDQLEEIDPTPNGKYVAWLVREYLKKKITLPEDAFHLNQVLVRFHRLKYLLENRDIFHYSKAKLAIAVSKLDLPEETHAEIRLTEKILGRKVLLGAVARSKRRLRVIQLTTALAAREASKGTDWCISSLEVAQDYISSGMLLLIEEFEVVKKKWKSLILSHVGYRTVRGSHEESPDHNVAVAQMMDIENEPIKRGYEFDFDVISNLLHHGFMTFLQQKIRIFGSDWDRQYWEEYLSDEDRNERDENRAYGNIEDGYEYCARLLVYTKVVLQRRDPWIEGQLLRNDSYGAVLVEYAKTIIKGPWLKAEPIIAKDERLRSDYMLYLFHIDEDRDINNLRIVAQRLMDARDE